MPIFSNFPQNPHEIADPASRWQPDDSLLQETTGDKLIPPLVACLREKVKDFRDANYAGAKPASVSLLNWWFGERHLLPRHNAPDEEFQYYFAQREALETLVYLFDVAGFKDKNDLLKYDSSGAISPAMFDETWRRVVIKMATGAGKTKVMSLALAWSYFHKLYEPESDMARNFLIVAPNIIVLDRLRKDFDGLRIFHQDPVLPANGYDGRNWRNDFQLRVHVQDEARAQSPTGNIFLTNIHRIYVGEDALAPTAEDDNTEDYFLGARPVANTTDSKLDLGKIVRDIGELALINDEAHHIHSPKQAGFEAIQDIHNRLLQKDAKLSFQFDVSATPKHNNGSIFVQTIADYPLVEAIYQNVVKHPTVPDEESCAKLAERQSNKFSERYKDYLDLGIKEWQKSAAVHAKLGKKAVLFVMTDDTRNCDDVAEYLQSACPELHDATLVIHTKNNGEISESSVGKSEKELQKLREAANKIDSADSKYKAIVSVLMLKEGWDVKNVVVIVGLRSYSSKAKILPEQTLGRGLRKMYEAEKEEYVSVLGTKAFMEFIKKIEKEGVQLGERKMDADSDPVAPLVVEIDHDNPQKDIAALDIMLPVLDRRFSRNYKSLALLNVAEFQFTPPPWREFDDTPRKIVFKAIVSDEVTHETELDGVAGDWRSAIAFFAQGLMRDLRLVGGYDVLYDKVREFVRDYLFGKPVDLESVNTLRNLATAAATKTVFDVFKREINALIVEDYGSPSTVGALRVSQTRPFIVKQQPYLKPQRSAFNIIVGDSAFELDFAAFLEGCPDVAAFAKNYLAVGFKLDYQNAEGNIVNYYPDFLVKTSDGDVVVVETKGREDVNDAAKIRRLFLWRDDVNAAQSNVRYDALYVKQEDFSRYRSQTFAELRDAFRNANWE